MMAILQVFVSMLLFFVMMFGIGFILNMLIKTTWFPVYLFIIVVLPLGMYYTWDKDLGFADNLSAYGAVDVVVAAGALFGAYMSGWTIRKLRIGGYKMF
nr:YuiB family protein [Paenibacillus darwinianus]